MTDDRAKQVASFMEWIAPAGGLESVAAEPRLTEIAKPQWATDEEVERASEAVERLEAGQPLEPAHAEALEAIILPQERPVVDIVDGTYDAPEEPFEHLAGGAAREHIEAAIPAVGRIDLPGHPKLPYAGTGFVVGDGLLMTNRHVAELFVVGIGREELLFTGQAAAIDFVHERGSDETRSFRIARVIMVHPYWDMALVATEGLDGSPTLRLAVVDPGDLRDRDVAVLGYPAVDPRSDIDLQNRIFRGIFSIKRMQPGKLRDRSEIRSFGHDVSAVTHDSSTLGGNSGSALVDVETGMVVALHFAGRYLEANYAVPSLELARDRRVVDAGVTFEGDLGDAGPLPSDQFWSAADPPGEAATATTATTGTAAAAPTASTPAPAAPQPLSWSIPFELTVGIRPTSGGVSAAPGAGSAAATGALSTGLEALVEPFRDEDFTERGGYDDEFLGLTVPLPGVSDQSVVSRLDDGSHVLPYEHFSIVMHKGRRLALFTAANTDASPTRKRPEAGKDYTRRGLTGLGENDQEKWFTDPRIPAIHQLPDRFFTKDRKSFDKGHIVRREDVAWGDSYKKLRRANGDTYHVTNCSPQIARFNRSGLQGVWGQLENMILAQANAERLSIFAGPVLRENDPIFRGVDDDGTVRVGIPRRFWKIVIACSGAELESFAFVLEQDLSDADLEFAVDELWRSRMISIPKLQAEVGLIEFPSELHESDQFRAPDGEALRAHPEVGTVED